MVSQGSSSVALPVVAAQCVASGMAGGFEYEGYGANVHAGAVAGFGQPRASGRDWPLLEGGIAGAGFGPSGEYPCTGGGSRYLACARQLLDEVVCLYSAAADRGTDSVRASGRCLGLARSAVESEASSQPRARSSKAGRRDAAGSRIAKLLRMLEELEGRYKRYCQQLDGVVSSFEGVAGRGAAKPYVTLTMEAMSRHFSNLGDLVMRELQAACSARSLLLDRRTAAATQTAMDGNTQQQVSDDRLVLRTMGMIPLRQTWRPLRGLPEGSVAILRKWLFEHFLHPYPKDNEKLMLSVQTGLTRNQISNWFINARVRLWKPIIEEIYRESL